MLKKTKMKLSIKLFYFAAFLLSAVSCGKEDSAGGGNSSDNNGTGNGNGVKTEFRLEPSVLAVRTPQLDDNGAGSFSTGDRLSLFITGNGTTTSQTYTHGNTHYWEDLELPAGANTLTVTGCYPQITATAFTDFTWNIQEQTEKDFLVAPAITVAKGNEDIIVLPFRHVLHKLSVVLQADGTTIQQEDIASAEIVIKQIYPATSVNLIEGTVGNASGNKISLSARGDKADFLIPAQPTTGITLSVKSGTQENSFNLSDYTIDGQNITRLEDGQSLCINLLATQDGFALSGISIGAWESQGSIDDTILI